MNKYIISLFITLVMNSCANAQNDQPLDGASKDEVQLPAGKNIYIPNDLKNMDLTDANSKWSYHRMAATDNFVIFWEKGFGPDLSKAPELEGQNMTVDLKNLEDKLEQFYSYFKDELKFSKPGSKSEKHRMMVMISYSLEGTAYGGDYDGEIGALWVTPNRIQDKALNCIAHELGHSFQAQISCDDDGKAWGGCGFFEMASQWMLWQVNPHWITDEKYHWDAFCKLTHKAYLHLENIYHSPFVLEYWGNKRGLPIIGELFRQGRVGEDPVMTYKRYANLSQSDFCDEMFDAYSKTVNWDYERVWDATRKYTNQYNTKFLVDSDEWLKIDPTNCPENYGFNAIPLSIPNVGQQVSISFCGNLADNNYNVLYPSKAGWRYGFVAITTDGKTIYEPISKENNGTIEYTIPTDVSLSHLWFLVMGAPSEHIMNTNDGKDAQWPYKIKITGSSVI